jgi:hypothetical protein
MTTDNRHEEIRTSQLGGLHQSFTCTTHAYEKQTNKQTNKQNKVADLGTLITAVPLQNELNEIQLYECQINNFR